jgi:hypothetical protein
MFLPAGTVKATPFVNCHPLRSTGAGTRIVQLDVLLIGILRLGVIHDLGDEHLGME